MQALSRKDMDETYPEVVKIKDINNTLNQLLSQTEDKHQMMREIKKIKNKK